MLFWEAFCRRGSTDRDWHDTILPFESRLLDTDPDARMMRLHTRVAEQVDVHQLVQCHPEGVTFDLEFVNRTGHGIDLDWAQPCLQVGAFVGRGQEDYFEKCFIFSDRGLTRMHETHRATEARYTPGQVYVPAGINRDDVNPRPISRTVPVNNLVGCFSADDSTILAMAWDRVQELFQGIITCIHSDVRIGGLRPGERKRRRGRLYLLGNDVPALLDRYERDFPASSGPD